MRISAMGPNAYLIECDTLDGVHQAYRQLREQKLPGIIDLVPGAVTLLVRHDATRVTADTLTNALRDHDTSEARTDAPRVITISVTYDGDDLADVAHHTGLSTDEVIEAHTGTQWTVAFSGFAPGFAYLTGGDARLHVPRRATPRTTVPAGSVGLAGHYSGIYPRPSPGGWNIIGTTTQTLWDLHADPPGLLQPGMHVKFVAQK
ncbi:5-oxoprolinase subunit PxpB [Hoyosella rhizosphaerae]|uniref:Carboxyltransferase domain-containing protein n=1 Tax=Hoyosella rhizosphaerae TaxID=1755582 RepID=A0A916UIP6_9ACTN|nr:5-oxoprolinase subunit PxpB [Hoyosella rhizosphaerae]MBN4928372.1 5-oxoprolinase subunit PxpB [Hoyosella rhizosphaerae]GGC74435.1 hypothetical protein GCM10011410_29670 [Hoyosella rhizosphaerae]